MADAVVDEEDLHRVVAQRQSDAHPQRLENAKRFKRRL